MLSLMSNQLCQLPFGRRKQIGVNIKFVGDTVNLMNGLQAIAFDECCLVIQSMVHAHWPNTIKILVRDHLQTVSADQVKPFVP